MRVHPLWRITPAWVALPLAVAVEVAAWLTRAPHWRGDPTWTADWFGTAPVLLGPLSAGVAALAVANLLRPGADQLYRLPPRGRWVPGRLVLQVGGACSLVHLCSVTLALVWGGWWFGIVRALGLLLVVAPQVALILLMASLGALCGKLFSPALAAGASSLLAFGLLFVLGAPSSRTPGIHLLYVGGATAPMELLRPRAVPLLVHALILTCLAAAFLVLPAARAARPVSRAMGVAGVAACLLLAISATPRLPVGGRYVADTGLQGTECESSADLTFCTFPEHRHWVLPSAQELAEVNRLSEAAELPAPFAATVREAAAPQATRGGETRLLSMPGWTAWTLAASAIQPSWCPELSGDTPPSEAAMLDAQTVLDAYTMAWQGLAVDQPTVERVRSITQRWRACEFS